MDLYKYLEEEYGKNVAIFVSEIKIENLTTNNIRQKISKLEKEGLIKHYSTGIYL